MVQPSEQWTYAAESTSAGWPLIDGAGKRVGHIHRYVDLMRILDAANAAGSARAAFDARADGWKASLRAADAARATDRREIKRLRAVVQEMLDQCNNEDCGLCERGRAVLAAAPVARTEEP